MNTWQSSAAEWLTQWLDALQALSIHTEPAALAQHFIHFAQLLQRYSEQAGDQAADSTAQVSALLAELQQQLAQARALHAAAVAPFDWSHASLTPVLGPTRAWHTRWRQWVHLATTQQAAVHALTNCHLDALDRALTRLRQELAAPDAKTLSSAHELYGWFTACADEAYREIAMTEAYSQHLGAAVNAFSGLHQQWRQSVTDSVEQLGLQALFTVAPAPPRAQTEVPQTEVPQTEVPQTEVPQEARPTTAVREHARPPTKPSAPIPQRSPPAKSPRREFDIGDLGPRSKG